MDERDMTELDRRWREYDEALKAAIERNRTKRVDDLRRQMADIDRKRSAWSRIFGGGK
jgi:hypothetical protein